MIGYVASMPIIYCITYKSLRADVVFTDKSALKAFRPGLHRGIPLLGLGKIGEKGITGEIKIVVRALQ